MACTTSERFSTPFMPVRLLLVVVKLALPVPSAPTISIGRSPPWPSVSAAVGVEWLPLLPGSKCPPAAPKGTMVLVTASTPGAQRPNSWRCMPCMPGVRPLTCTLICMPVPTCKGGAAQLLALGVHQGGGGRQGHGLGAPCPGQSQQAEGQEPLHLAPPVYITR